VKCGFSSNDDDSAVKLSEDEDDDLHSLQSLGVQFKDYTTCDSVSGVCGIQNVDQVLKKHLTWSHEVAEYKATFLDALSGLEAARKYMCQFVTENIIIVTFNKVEN
jgi:hypothetical protein